MEFSESSTKLVALSLADMSNDEGVCWPSVRSLCERCGVKDRQLRRILEKLKIDGVIAREARFSENRQKSSITHFTPWIVQQSQGRAVVHDRGEGVVEDRPRIVSNEPSSLKKSKGSPKVFGEEFSPVWIPDDRTWEEKIRAMKPPKSFPSEQEFNHFLDSEEFEHLNVRKSTDDLYRTFCKNKWCINRHGNPVRIKDWKKFFAGLNGRIGENLTGL